MLNCPALELNERLKDIKTAAIGPLTTATALQNGINIDIQPSNYTIPDMVQAIVDAAKGGTKG